MFRRILVFLLVLSMLTCIVSVQVYGGDANRELKIGAWVGTQPAQADINRYQELQQKKLDIVHQFIDWSTNFSYVKPYADAVYNNGSVLMITWEPWEYTTVDINNGKADSYLNRMAQDIKSYGKEIWLRPLHEANGDWYPWAIGHKNKVNTNETYKAAFRHVVDIFRNNGVSNVKWVHNVNCSNVGEGTSFLGFYPGDNYVDYTSIDGYNWGTTQSWGSVWQTFDQIFLQSYNAIKTINKPIILAEFASTEIGGDKAKWVTESFNTIRTSYDKIFAAVWFSENKETDWRINSSAATLEAFKKAIAVGTSAPTPIPSSTPTIISSPIPTSTSGNNTSPKEMVIKMGMGTNLGNTLEPPYEGDWSKVAMEYYFDDFKTAGYKNVRIPVRWDNHSGKSYPYTVDKTFMDRVEQVVDWSLSKGFVTVLNSHHDEWIMEDYDGNIERFEKIWEQIAERFKDKSENLLFEILNESHGNITDSQINDMNKRILNIIRKNNPNRIVILGSNFWNSYNTLSNLSIPNDPNLMATFHYYDPFDFTHNWKGTWGTQADMDNMARVFDYVKNWSEKNNIPVYLGEFAVMAYADKPSRLKWYDFISDLALNRGFACSVWDNGVFGSLEYDMGIYNRDTRTFDTEVLNAIMNPGSFPSITPIPITPTTTPKPPVTPAVGEKMHDDFEGRVKWDAYYGEGATVSLQTVNGKSGDGLEITYVGGSDSYWGVANGVEDDWSEWLKISFDIKSVDTSTNEIRFLISEKGLTPGEDGEHWVYTLTPDTSWETIEIPFSNFIRRPDYQPPSQDMSGTLDLDKVNAIHFMYSNAKSGKFIVDNIKLIGETSTTSPTPTVKLGDVNYDGSIDSTDYAIIKRYILGTLKFDIKEEEGKFYEAADLNEDGSVNSTDYALLKRYILGTIDKF